jgi:hypothetical protein
LQKYELPKQTVSTIKSRIGKEKLGQARTKNRKTAKTAERLAATGGANDESACLMSRSRDLLARGFAAAIKKGRQRRKTSDESL